MAAFTEVSVTSTTDYPMVFLFQPRDFPEKINRYIASTEMGHGGDFWPIVKKVKLRLPNCGICKSGATLVDLPGIRDSNAARDKIAKDVSRCSVAFTSVLFFTPNL